MSLFDWVEMGFADHGQELDWFKGSLSVTIGDILIGKYGASHEHVFGPRVQMVCDPEDMLLSQLDKFMPLVSGMLSGVGGNFVLNYGSSFSGTYFGPKMDVRRAPGHSKTSNNLLAHKTAVVDGATQETDEIDKATSIAAAALSTLIVATAAALEMALHFAYPKFGSTNPDDGKTIEGYGKTPGLLRICSYTVTSRVMALLKTLEEKGSFADFGKQFLLEGKFLGLVLLALGSLAVHVVTLTSVANGADLFLAKAISDAAKALGNAAQ